MQDGVRQIGGADFVHAGDAGDRGGDVDRAGVIGIYGVLSYTVSQRRREIGIRLALGAQGRDVLGMVLDREPRMALAGVAIGVVVALGLTRLMANLLFGVSADDPMTFGLWRCCCRVSRWRRAISGAAGDRGRSDGGAAVRLRIFGRAGRQRQNDTFLELKPLSWGP